MGFQPVFPEDVLLEVLAAADRPEAARMMSTSRFLYSEGSKIILRKPITISSDRCLSRFLVFILAEGTRRTKFVRSLSFCNLDGEDFGQLRIALLDMSNLASLSVTTSSELQLLASLELLGSCNKADDKGLYRILRSLTIENMEISHEASQTLIAALPYMTDLQNLNLPPGDMFLESHPALPSALAELPAIQTLQLAYIYEQGITMLKALRSPLVSARLHFDALGDATFFDTADETDLLEVHPVRLLSHSQSSLEELFAYGWLTHLDILPDTSLVYPKMRRLDLEYTEWPLTMAYIRAYPNLTHLRYHTLDADLPVYKGYLDALDNRHRLNVEAQRLSKHNWNSLQRVSGSLVDVYMLGLTCPVDNLRISNAPDGHCYQLGPILALTRPRHLELNDWFGTLSGPAGDAFAALQGDGGSRLVSLNCRKRLNEKHGDVDIGAIMEGFKVSLSHTPVQQIKISVLFSGLDTRPRPGSSYDIALRQLDRLRKLPPPNPADYPMCLAERSAAQFDLKRYMASLMDAVPTLRQAEITFDGPRRFWKRVSLESEQLRYDER
ncbi:hypothetical protein FKP32DRAFT_1594811 [Trametes sanguinea]|nr:hypothetical protein FKP32DRAFT_1594811 [Trametes sanguinea]